MLTTSPSPESARENSAPLPSWPGPEAVLLETLDLPGLKAEPAPAGLVLVFASTTEVLNAEDRLEAEDFNFVLIPVPKEVNPNCGLALSIPEEAAPEISQALARAGLNPLAVYKRQGGGFTLLPTEVFRVIR
ncbi:MAG: DUF3343 domain-containing protein [Deltaproteobacteria bacterium]|nr:DUF3343 domain-containing protein [Deltaproteobacteria bacterium]